MDARISPASLTSSTSSTTPPDALMPVMAVERIHLTLNGSTHELAVEPWVTLLDLLREQLDLTGTKKGCDHGQCGACTVLVDGARMNACLLLAVSLDGCAVTTIEGLPALAGDRVVPPHNLHPLQQSFIDCDALQCGYCTPGQLCSAAGLMNEHRPRNRAEIRERMSGNLCRCGAYPQIVDAVARVVLMPSIALPAVCAAAASMVVSPEQSGEVRS